MVRLKTTLCFAFLLSAMATFAPAAEEVGKAKPVDIYNVPAKAPVAIAGYDPVAYFTDKKAVEGTERFKAVQDGIEYHFASAEHCDLFTKDPGKYKPAYGGWCATAMAYGKKVEIDPENFIVEHGRLFLFYKSFFQNAKNAWTADEPKMLRDADASWQKLSGEAAPKVQ